MEKQGDNKVLQRIRLNDGYRGEPIWKQPENDSTYYNGEVDAQCRVPVRSREKLIAKLGIGQ
ncbi:MAG: hypothetical protein K2G55_13345 [Lachnospiraceae bacterium]|nr:hypothetical protein [Lachnospiraceae bacterium]MDE7203507.1 hypothetical protein [Lachnospiraceae bacterium]